MRGNRKGNARKPSPNLVSSRLVYQALGEKADFYNQGDQRGLFRDPTGAKHEERTAGDYAQRSCRWRLPREGSLEAWDFWQQNKGSVSAVTEHVAPWEQALQESHVRWHVLWAKQ